MRERTIAEVRTRLERAALPDREIDGAIAELVDFGYLDDARYARVFASDKRALESWGADRITRALASRGVERELIAAALNDPGGDDDQARAIELLQRRFASPPADLRACERALGVLIRKGYTSEVAYEAVRAWAGDVDD